MPPKKGITPAMLYKYTAAHAHYFITNRHNHKILLKGYAQCQLLNTLNAILYSKMPYFLKGHL